MDTGIGCLRGGGAGCGRDVRGGMGGGAVFFPDETEDTADDIAGCEFWG